MMRAFFALFLSLMLALTSHSVAVAKGAPAAVDQMVICTGHGATVVYTDAEGQPTTAPHLCPNCVMHLDEGVLPVFGASPIALSVVRRGTVLIDTSAIASKTTQSPPARGPPGAV